MKYYINLLLCTLLVTGCSLNPFKSSQSPGLNPAQSTSVPVKDQTIRTDYSDQGVQIEYTWTGDLKRIVVFGYAEAWKGNVDIHAELDAMDKLVKFRHGIDVNTDRKVKIYARTIDSARDNTLNRFKNIDGTLVVPAKEIESELAADPNKQESEKSNRSKRIAERLERTVTETVQSITSQGRLTGVRKVNGRVIQNGKIYVAEYEWSPKNEEARSIMSNLMGK